MTSEGTIQGREEFKEIQYVLKWNNVKCCLFLPWSLEMWYDSCDQIWNPLMTSILHILVRLVVVRTCISKSSLFSLPTKAKCSVKKEAFTYGRDDGV